MGAASRAKETDSNTRRRPFSDLAPAPLRTHDNHTCCHVRRSLRGTVTLRRWHTRHCPASQNHRWHTCPPQPHTTIVSIPGTLRVEYLFSPAPQGVVHLHIALPRDAPIHHHPPIGFRSLCNGTEHPMGQSW